MSVIIAMILSTGITTHSPVFHVQMLHNGTVAFSDITGTERICSVGQYGVYWRGQSAFQILSCSTDTIFHNGFEP